jgi:hypothetical protein
MTSSKELYISDLPAEMSYGEQDENGVDVSLIRWVLSKTPLERLQIMERAARDTKKLNEYGRKLREASQLEQTRKREAPQ